MRTCRFSLLGAILALTAFVPGMARAQAPSISAVFPSGGQRGTTPTISILGGNLQDAKHVLISGKGVTATIGEKPAAGNLPIQLKVAADAEPGLHEIRVITARGASNAGRIWIDVYEETNEKEPNNTLAQAQAVTKMPVVMNGQTNGGQDVDVYTFDAKKGDTYVFEIFAARYLSPMDCSMTLRDVGKHILGTAQNRYKQDARLIHTFKADGKYTLSVHDTMYRGGANYVYRLRMGKLPIITSALPMGGTRGSTVTVALTGYNLGEMTQMSVKLPADKGTDVTYVVAQTSGGPTNPIPIYLSDMTEAVESEPNDSWNRSNPLPSPPVMVSGLLQKNKDRDYFAFAAVKGQAILVEVHARRLGSLMDSTIRVMDANQKVLASNDDAVGADSRLTFTPPADGAYYVEVRSLDNRGGSGFFYRLQISDPPAPDYALRLRPGNITISKNSSTAITVVAERRGFTGDIQVRFENLPKGVTATPITIATGQNSGQTTLNAAADADQDGSLIRIIGTGSINGRTLERVAGPQESYKVKGNNNTLYRNNRLTVAGVGPAKQYSLRLEPAMVTITQGQKVTIKVIATRQAKFDDAIAITQASLPTGVKGQNVSIPKGKTEITFTLTAAGNAKVQTQNTIVNGNGKKIVLSAPALKIIVKKK